MPSAASALNPLRNDNQDDHYDPGGSVEAHEMDTLPQAPTHGRSLSRSRSMILGEDKVLEPLTPPKPLGKGDYAVGILLLLSVVVLWTSSNFITQVSVEGSSSAWIDFRSESLRGGI